jgi:predicted transcriptional regulator
MKILWARGSATSEDVREALTPGRSLKDSTVRTILRRLREKGYVKYRLAGRTYIYSSIEDRPTVAARAIRQIIDRFCQGSVEQLLAGMVENEILSRSELRRLARKIDGRKAHREE